MIYRENIILLISISQVCVRECYDENKSSRNFWKFNYKTSEPQEQVK